MEAIIEKKQPRMTGRWQARLFRLQDRHLVYWGKEVTDFRAAHDNDAKAKLDLTHLINVKVDKKNQNVLILRHPQRDLAMRFSDVNTFVAWLKVLASFGTNEGRKIDTSIPTNYSNALWHVLQALYTHPKRMPLYFLHLFVYLVATLGCCVKYTHYNTVTSEEGVFRKSGSGATKAKLLQSLLIEGLFFVYLFIFYI